MKKQSRELSDITGTQVPALLGQGTFSNQEPQKGKEALLALPAHVLPPRSASGRHPEKQ